MPDGSLAPLDFCSAGPSDPVPCPTFEMLLEMICVLPPRGDAWQTNEDIANFDPDTQLRDMTVQQQYWAAIAQFFAWVYEEICKLDPEFWCATADKFLPEWQADYGFPDKCEAFDNLCEKVHAVGGSRCEDYVAMAASRGWVIECGKCTPWVGASPVADCAIADCAHLCGCDESEMHFRILVDQSPSFTAVTPMVADCAIADCTPPCVPADDHLICLLERAKPAHARFRYQIVRG